MDTEGQQDLIKTPDAVGTIACVMGTIGAMLFALIAVAVVISNSFSAVSIWAAAALVLMGAASAVSLVGLCALFCGSQLGRRFALPFAVSFGAWLCPIVAYLLTATDVSLDGYVVFAMWDGGTVSGIVGGWFLAGRISGFGRRSRVLGSGGAVLMMLLGGWFMVTNGGLGDNIFAEPGAVFLFAIGLCVFAILGGVPGALVGSVRTAAALREIGEQ